MRRVLVPTDFSAAGLLVTREALSWVDTMGGELLLLHVVPDIFLPWCDHLAIGFIDQRRLQSAYEDLRAAGQRQFSTWLLYQAHERCRTLVAVGDPAGRILEVAQQERVDVIIMRAPKRRWWRHGLSGSVTHTIMRKAPVPVVVWAGPDQRAAKGWWQGAPRSCEEDAPQAGAWPEQRREPWERTPLQKSW